MTVLVKAGRCALPTQDMNTPLDNDESNQYNANMVNIIRKPTSILTNVFVQIITIFFTLSEL